MIKYCKTLQLIRILQVKRPVFIHLNSMYLKYTFSVTLEMSLLWLNIFIAFLLNISTHLF